MRRLRDTQRYTDGDPCEYIKQNQMDSKKKKKKKLLYHFHPRLTKNNLLIFFIIVLTISISQFYLKMHFFWLMSYILLNYQLASLTKRARVSIHFYIF